MIYSSVVERMEMDSGAKVIVRDPEILGGIPVFLGTRVPFKNLLDYLEGGHTLDEILGGVSIPSHARQPSPRWSMLSCFSSASNKGLR